MISTMDGTKTTPITESFRNRTLTARDFSTPNGERMVVIPQTFLNSLEGYRDLFIRLRERLNDSGFKIVTPSIEPIDKDVYFSINASTVPMSSFRPDNNSEGMMSNIYAMVKELVSEFDLPDKALKDILAVIGISNVRENEVVLLFNFEQ